MKSLIQGITFQVVGIVALAFAAGVTVISAAYGLYAALRLGLGPAGSAALTSLAAAILVAILAVVVIRLKPGTNKAKAAERRGLDPELIHNIVSVGGTVAALAADLALQHRLKRKPTKHDKRRSKRR